MEDLSEKSKKDRKRVKKEKKRKKIRREFADDKDDHSWTAKTAYNHLHGDDHVTERHTRSKREFSNTESDK